jgi:hypothetical protein
LARILAENFPAKFLDRPLEAILEIDFYREVHEKSTGSVSLKTHPGAG